MYLGSTYDVHLMVSIFDILNSSKEKRVMDDKEEVIESGVIPILFPPKTCNKLQPIDVGMRSLFKKLNHEKIESWLRSHPVRVVNIYQISKLVDKTYLCVQATEILINSFKKCVLLSSRKAQQLHYDDYERCDEFAEKCYDTNNQNVLR